MMVIEEAFQLGQIVYLKTDIEQLPFIITGIQVRPNGGLRYLCSQGPSQEMECYDIELTDSVNVALKTQ